MLKKIENLKNVTILSKQAQKNVGGGMTCGIKVGGVWYMSMDMNGSGGTKDDAVGSLGQDFYFADGTPAGTATNWCCASCPWN